MKRLASALMGIALMFAFVANSTAEVKSCCNGSSCCHGNFCCKSKT
jgi:hypothetical protein